MPAFTFFGINLSHVRTVKGLKQSELAARAGKPFTQGLVSHYERGLRPSSAHVRRLAEVLGVPPEALLRPPRVIRQHDALQAVVVEDATSCERQPRNSSKADERNGRTEGGAA